MSIERHRCDICGKLTDIGLLDAKPGPGEWTADQLSAAADRGEDFDRLECGTCYGPNYVPLDPARRA